MRLNPLPAKNVVRDAEAEVDAAKRLLASFEEQHAKIGAAPIDEGDAEQLIARDEQLELVARKISAARKAVATRESRAEHVRDEARLAAAKRLNAEMDKRAEAEKKRFARMFERMEELKEDLAWASDHVADFARYNAERGDLPFVYDAEFRLRQVPGAMVPEVVESYEWWVDKDGKAVSETVWDRGRQKYVKNPAIVGRGTVRNVQREAYQMPASMPPRVCGEIVLVSRDGRKIWPK